MSDIITTDEIEKIMKNVSRDTIVLCAFYKEVGKGERDVRFVRLEDCELLAAVIDGCIAWQPFLSMHRAVHTCEGQKKL